MLKRLCFGLFTVGFLIISIPSNGQVEALDTSFIKEAIAPIEDTAIAYVKDVKRGNYLKYAVIKRKPYTDTAKFVGTSIIKLSQDEVDYLIDRIEKDTNLYWPAKLFSSSVSVKQNLMWDWLSRENKKRLLRRTELFSKKDTLHANAIKSARIYSFSKPIYIRNGTICLFYYASMCGPGCGYMTLAFYRKENEKWTVWDIIDGGDF